ncbi:hypothetical protein KC331_g25 [Hortaea werneckii]|nr:hypothetical protein KC331_g25 [Hortaea werneckii]
MPHLLIPCQLLSVDESSDPNSCSNPLNDPLRLIPSRLPPNDRGSSVVPSCSSVQPAQPVDDFRPFVVGAKNNPLRSNHTK